MWLNKLLGMEPITTITISCQGATTVILDELNDLQGNLKDLSDENYAQLRNSIVEFGFSFPIFMWIDSENKKWIVDAHQRKRTLKRMRDEGITIPPLPADIIFAKDKTEAKKKLLLQESKYGKITEEGLYEYMNEPGLELDAVEMGDYLAMDEFDREYKSHPADNEQDTNQPREPKEIECPECHAKFTVDKTN